ncbi:hypothetical protein MMC06_006259 [Schaereria dolodes]|nr:hypothetical protein [Schaereria dolodes]
MSEEYAEVCDDDGFGAAWVNGTQFIMICPIFLQSKAIKAYPVAADCATQEDLWVNQYSILVHELIHLYLGTLGKAALVPEVYNSTECMGLSAADALINPHNYAYYVGNVKAGCTDVFETTLPPTTGSSDLTNLASQYKEVVPLNKSCAIGTNELTYLNCSTDNLFLADDATAK